MKQKMFIALALSLSALFAASCSSSGQNKSQEDQSELRKKMEKTAQQYLSQARSKLAQKQLEAAKATIGDMRKKCYQAITARKEGILLMDSIDLEMARQELVRTDSLLHAGEPQLSQSDFDEACRKVEFYERKLRHDIAAQNKEQK